jgi:thiol-disulfide isomerase/thioredoxin
VSRRDPRTTRRVAVFVALLVVVCASTVMSALLLRLTRAEQDELARVAAARRACEAEPATAPVAAPAPVVRAAGPPASQPQSTTAYIPRGTEIQPAMRLMLERVVPDDGGAAQVRLGAKEVLPPTRVHVLSLWAPWCGPCKHLLPRLRAMFERRAADWQAEVDFVPIQVDDASSPEQSYATFRHLMPDSPAQLADRSRDGDLMAVLRAPSRALYRGNLPLTMLLDCNRRVRWAREGAFGPADERDLEKWIDEFAGQLRRGDAECRERWCGNGRCEPGEQDSCEDDCGPPPPVATPPPTTAPAVPCPADCLTCDELGRCIARRATVAATCGNGRCERGETSASCCLDCLCRAPLVCRANIQGRMVCAPRPLEE